MVVSRLLLFPVVLALLVGAPIAIAAAQRVEIAAFVGGSQALPVTWTSEANRLQCPPVVAPCQASVTRHSGTMLGARIRFGYTPRLGIDATVRGVLASEVVESNDGTGAISSAQEDVTEIVMAIQPSVRLPLRRSLEVFAAAGPALSLLGTTGRLGVAFNGGASVDLGAAFTAVLEGGYAAYVRPKELDVRYVIAPAESSPPSVNNVSWSLGLAYRFANGQGK